MKFETRVCFLGENTFQRSYFPVSSTNVKVLQNDVLQQSLTTDLQVKSEWGTVKVLDTENVSVIGSFKFDLQLSRAI
jgi:hypothetical protein